MKKFIKRATAVLSALALVMGMTAVTPKEVLAKESEAYTSSLGYKTKYCSDDFAVSQTGNVDTFSLKGQNLAKEIPVAVSIEKTADSADTVIKGAQLQSKQNPAISKSTFGKNALPSQSIRYETKDDTRGTCKITVIAVQGKNANYIVTVTQGASVAEKIGTDIESILGGFEETTGTTKTSVSKLYKNKLKQLKKKKKYKKGISSVQIKVGKGSKILVVTPTKNLYGDGVSICADIYQAVNGKVKYICEVKSNGTSYPIAFTKKAILVAGNHFAGKLEINNGKATYTEISKYLMEKSKPVLKKYSVKNNKFKVLSSKKISRKKAEKIFFYCNSKDKIRGEIIEWKKE